MPKIKLPKQSNEALCREAKALKKQRDAAEAQEAIERREYLALVRKHRGSISAIADSLKMTRQSLTRRLVRHGLLPDAELARVRANIPGPRPHLDFAGPQVARERAQLTKAMCEAGGYRSAAKLLGIGDATMYRRLKRYGITAADIEKARAEV